MSTKVASSRFTSSNSWSCPIIGVLIRLLLPAVKRCGAANRVKCQNNLKQMRIACHTPGFSAPSAGQYHLERSSPSYRTAPAVYDQAWGRGCQIPHTSAGQVWRNQADAAAVAPAPPIYCCTKSVETYGQGYQRASRHDGLRRNAALAGTADRQCRTLQFHARELARFRLLQH